MSAEENKALVRRYLDEVWARGNIAAVETFLAPTYQRHLAPTTTPLTRDGQHARLAGFRDAFPDAELTIEEMLAEGDRVAFRSTLRGTHQGVFFGIPPTGKRITVGLIDIVRIEEGNITEQWGGPDLLDLLQQLGADLSVGSKPQ